MTLIHFCYNLTMGSGLNAATLNRRSFRYELDSSTGKLLLRTLNADDETKLAEFIGGLSPITKHFYSYNEPNEVIAKEICDAIGKYDKLRFVLELDDTHDLIGLFEISLDIPEPDMKRYQSYGVKLTPSDCRFGPLLRDDYQSKGLGSLVLTVIIDIAKKLGRNRIILWGGVHQTNAQAIRFYQKNDFRIVGSFTNHDELPCYDMMIDIHDPT